MCNLDKNIHTLDLVVNRTFPAGGGTILLDVLAAHGGNVTRTATALGLSRAMLQNKMKELGLRST